MPADPPAFTLGVEEEYLLVDIETLDLADAPAALVKACAKDLGDRVSPEFLKCQIEIGTGVCKDVGEAREELSHLRRTIAKHASEYGLAPIAAACHPFADWKKQIHTDKDRYNELRKDLANVARRMLICGMHVHVGVEDEDTRIDLVNQLSYFLPHLLALSVSSPYWQGDDTGLSSYRLTVFDNLPRTGLPPRMANWQDFRRSVKTLIDLDILEDASKIWWDLRPSARFPTIETRIFDGSPRLETTLTLTAVTQSLVRWLWRLLQNGDPRPLLDTFLIEENRWRAQRYGPSEGLIDFGKREIVPAEALVSELIELVSEDAAELGCLPELQAAATILETGTAADRQRAVRAATLETGATEREAMETVVRHLIAEFHHGL
ncbi:carboxylate-amine ligase [Aestuariibius sp. 2305UL40-4]|uniref:carboxylate-amine ligase n=1 Tax=Aestuariibius violaceus TaxID=3234132 RepID=UPI00345E427F